MSERERETRDVVVGMVGRSTSVVAVVVNGNISTSMIIIDVW